MYHLYLEVSSSLTLPFHGFYSINSVLNVLIPCTTHFSNMTPPFLVNSFAPNARLLIKCNKKCFPACCCCCNMYADVKQKLNKVTIFLRLEVARLAVSSPPAPHFQLRATPTPQFRYYLLFRVSDYESN